MLMDVYYAAYTDRDGSPLRVNESDKILPYLIEFPTKYNMEQFTKKLQQSYFINAASNKSYRHLLVNMTFQRFAVIEKACKHECVGGRVYTEQEFLEEVLLPWQKHRQKDLSGITMEIDGDKYIFALMSEALERKLDMEYNKITDAVSAAMRNKQPIPPRNTISPLPPEYKVGIGRVIRSRFSATTTTLRTRYSSPTDGILVEHRNSWEETRCYEHLPEAKDLVPIVPVLIPLNKDGNPTRELFRSEPNGALTTGGSLYYIQGGTTREWDGEGSPIRMKNYTTKKAWIGNTGEHPLEWMFWDGCLVALRPFLQLRPKDIWESGLAMVDIDILPGAALEGDPVPEMEDIYLEEE